MTAYIIDRSGFALIWELIGGKISDIPEEMRGALTEENYDEELKKLSDVGYVHDSNGIVNIERTIGFLIRSILGGEYNVYDDNKKRRIFYCKKLIIVSENDRYSAKKIRLVPLQNEKMLEEYLLEEQEDESDNG